MLWNPLLHTTIVESNMKSMEDTESYVVFYNNGVADGLHYPQEDAELQSNVKTMQDRLEANWNAIETAKILEGLTVHSRQKYTGALCVSGPAAKIDELKAFLEEKNLGTVVPNNVVCGADGAMESRNHL